MLYWLPTWVQLFHHHEELSLCTAKNEHHFHTQHHSCEICDFQISFFTFDFSNYKISEEQPELQLFIIKNEVIYTPTTSHHFLLRAPPVIT